MISMQWQLGIDLKLVHFLVVSGVLFCIGIFGVLSRRHLVQILMSIELILNAVGWREGVIDASICSEDVARGRPAPFMIFRAMETTGVIEVKRVIKVGDTAFDLRAGRNAGVGGVVGVLSGSQGIERLGRVEHTHILSSVAVLPALLESEFG